jgi:hypothetical protein
MLKRIIFTLALAAFCAFTQPGYGQEQGVTDIQNVLKQCGFDPGPVDGLWGSKTANAASKFLGAHGEPPNSTDKSDLIAMVDFYRTGDQGPCPADSEATGPVEVAEGNPVQAEGSGSGNSTGTDQHFIEVSNEINEALKETEVSYYRDEEFSVTNGILKGVTDNWYLPVPISAVERMDWNRYGDAISWHCYLDSAIALEAGPALTTSTICAYIHLGRTDRNTNKRLFPPLFQKFNTALSQYNGAPDPSTPQCFEWADLGSISTGAWRNAYGKVAKSFPSGDLGKVYDNAELVSNYKASHQHCLVGNERAMNQALIDMVVVGRQATEVDAEKIRIRDYFEGKVKECQAEFTRRFKQYDGKLCN